MSQDFKPIADLLDGARQMPGSIPDPTSRDGSDTPPAKISGVPIGRISDTFSNFDLTKNPEMKRALARCQLVASGKAWCALLGGNAGTGKTHLAIAAMHEFGMGRSYFWKVPDYLDWLRHMAFDENMGVEEVTKSYRSSPFLLVLDDLGVENPTDWAHEQLYRVLDSRYDNRLPTIITTNQPQSRIDERLLSRYAEGLVACEGRDVRRAPKVGR